MTRRLISRALWPPYRKLRGIEPYWKLLTHFDSWSERQQEQLLIDRLKQQVRHFASRPEALPEWKQAAQIESSEEFRAAWQSLPILTKEDLQTTFHPDRLTPPSVSDWTTGSTGGSTGEPTPFAHDRQMRLAAWAATLFSRTRMGWRPGMPLIIVWGSERDIGRTRSLEGRIKSYLQNHFMVDGYGLGDETVDTVLDLIARRGPCAVYGFTSMLDFIARKTLQKGITTRSGRVITAWNGGEMLYPEQVETFEKAFGVPLLNFYGGRELSAMAFQETSGQALRVLRPLLFAEVVDDEGYPSFPDQPGRLIWTSTVCRATPFLRYDVGDLGVFTGAGKDQAGIREIEQLHGRKAGLLQLPDGRSLSCLFWNHLFKEFSSVEQFQVIARTNGGITLRLRGDGWSGDEEAYLDSVLTPLFGEQGYETEWVGTIPLTREGKLEQVVRESSAP